MALSKGKPLILGEVGNPPSLEILESQPNWALWVIWAGMVRNTSKKQHKILVDNPRILSLEDPVYHELITPYRAACDLPSLPLMEKNINFSGIWVLNEEKSVLDNWGVANQPYKLKLRQQENDLDIERSFIVEWGDDRITTEILTLDGKESESEFWNSPRITTANWSEKGDTLFIKSKVIFSRGGRTTEMMTSEAWSLSQQNSVLSITQTTTSFRGDRKITLIFDRQ